MQTHDIIQGTPEWHQLRATHKNASDAPVMMGVSPYKTRGEFMRELATGIKPYIDAATQRRFDDGHHFEALARTLAEKIIGEELYPVVGSFGNLAASFDGLNMDETIVFEHKTLNDEIRKCQDSTDLPLHYRIQMEQQLLVSGASEVLFMASKWSDMDELIEEKHFFYQPDGRLQEQIIAGWAQFEKDMAEFHPKEAKAEPEGRAPELLPALRIELSGGVTTSNLADFKASAMAIFAGIKTELTSDEDFADADKTTKWCKEVEDRLDAAKQHALSQTASIDELFRAIDAIKEGARQKRLTLEKLVKSRKDSIRIEKVTAAQNALLSHVTELQAEIVGVRLLVQAPDFGGAIKGLKSIDSIDNSLDTALANAKIAANAKAKDVRNKLAWFKDQSTGYAMLFNDLQQLIEKPQDDFELAVTSRINEQKQRKAEKLEAEREKIRLEEQAKAEVNPVTVAEVAQLTIPEPEPIDPPADEQPTLSLGVISARLGFTVSGEFIRSLGFEPVKVKSTSLYHESQFPAICGAIIRHVTNVLRG